MNKTFKKVLACMLAVLMVVFSVPFTAFAAGEDTTVYTPDIQLQFGTLFDANPRYDGDTETWVDNFASGAIETSGNGAQPDLTASALAGPILAADATVSKSKAKLTVKGLTIEAADTANYDNDDFTALAADYNLKAGDAFTVTVRMDNLSQVYIATAEIAYSGNLEPLYYTTNGKTGKNYAGAMGTAAQVEADASEWGKAAMADYDAQALYNGINEDEIGSELQTDYDGVNYMYAECIAPNGADWSAVNNANAPDLTNEDGSFGNDYAGKSVMATFAFVLKEDLDAEHPIYFWVHNGSTDAHKKSDTGADTFSSFGEGSYSPARTNIALSTYTTYALNKFESGDNQFNGAENFGSHKMTFMGVNENVVVHTPGTPVEENRVEPTCTVAGSYDMVTYCTDEDCGKELSRETIEIPAMGHDLGDWRVTEEAVAPSCTETGKTAVEISACSRCDYIETRGGEEVAALGHDFGDWTVTTPAVDATCTTTGTTAIETRACSRCDVTETRGGEETPVIEHSWNDGEITTPSTCIEKGVKTFTCTVCGATKTEEVPFADHAYEAVVTEPTCEEGGYTTFTCTVCGDSFTADETDAIGHNWGEWTIDTPEVAPTCKEQGRTAIEVRVCANDPTHKEVRGYEAIPALGHEYTAVVTAPTCTEGGYTTYTCTRCGESYQDEFTEATGHKWNDGEVTTAATCTAEGVKTYTCTICSETKTEAIAKAAHTVVVDKAVPATFKKAGKTEGSHCSVCGTVITAQKAVKKLVSPTITKVKAGKKSFTATWKKSATVAGYQLQYSPAKNFKKGAKTVTVKKAKTTKKVVKKLKGGKAYYVRVRAYKTINGKKVYSSWSKAKAVKTKK